MNSGLERSRWDRLRPSAREALAVSIVRNHPSFEFDGIEAHSQGDQHHYVAFFRRDGARFALIPGGHATLGHDPSRGWKPNEEESEAWDAFLSHSQDAFPPLEEYIVQFLSPLRSVYIAPFLLEVVPQAIGQRRLAEGDPLWDPEAVRRTAK